ncbi:inositol monophosphatase family protein [Aeoliella mucimassa]|uniref:Inositol-1-monophosphatase n=1 Tax=Aeoliella mucimassa TaxID=2527972 RepID=A0A518AWQ3_9BACT|nr:inositol monophosphatase family protein [Aeoliella mucimassa]QDU59162.1 Inositol-1-monophosphatase [Aeoliella mucimassa]
MNTLTLPPTNSPYDDLLRVGLLAAAAGGAKLMEWRGKFTAREKSPADMVTDADLASQKAIREVIATHHPEHAFVGEEDPGQVKQLLEEPVCWVVDPLDGTTNYVHDFPAYAVSIGAVVEGELAAGVIYNPLTGDVYGAARGGGAWCNEQRMQVSETTQLSDALLAMSLPPQARSESPDVLDFVAMVGRARALRRIGSAALNLAYVAQGVLDGHWARMIHPWDVAAGVLLVQEAGGVVSASNGQPFNLAAAHFVVGATAALHAEMVQTLRESGAKLPDA